MFLPSFQGFDKAGFGDPDALAFFARVTAAGGSLTTTEKTAVTQLVVDMKGFGIWTSMKAIYPMVGASAAACAQNLKSLSFTGAFSTGWTFASTGVTPNGTSAFMDTGLKANLMSQNSAHANFYSRTNNLASIGQVELGSSAGTDYQISIRYDGGGGLGNLSRLNNSFVGSSYIPTKTTGFFTISRTASTTTKLYEDGVVKATLASASLSPTAINIFISARNDVGSPALYSTKQCAFSSIGDGLTDTQASNFYTAVQAFQTTLSRQV